VRSFTAAAAIPSYVELADYAQIDDDLADVREAMRRFFQPSEAHGLAKRQRLRQLIIRLNDALVP